MSTRKLYRIETAVRREAVASSEPGTDRHRELMSELKAIRALVAQGGRD